LEKVTEGGGSGVMGEGKGYTTRTQGSAGGEGGLVKKREVGPGDKTVDGGEKGTRGGSV